MRQSTTSGRISHSHYMKVDSNPEVFSRPVLCARFAVFNAPDNLGICSPCQPVLDRPNLRLEFPARCHPGSRHPGNFLLMCHRVFLKLSTSRRNSRTQCSLLVCTCMSTLLKGTRNLSVTRKFMDVCDVKTTGEDGSVSQHDNRSKEHPLIQITMWPARFVFSLCIQTPALRCTYEVRLWINRVASEIAFQPFIQTPALVALLFSAWCHCGMCHRDFLLY